MPLGIPAPPPTPVAEPGPSTKSARTGHHIGCRRGSQVSDTSQGPGWWLASDGMWYPPETAPPPPPPPPPPVQDLTSRQPSPWTRRPFQRARAQHGRTPGADEPPPPAAPPPGEKPLVKRWWFWTTVGVVAVVIIGGIVWAGEKNNPASSGTSITHGAAIGRTSTTRSHQPTSTSTTTSSSTTTTFRNIPPTAFFACSGSAPGGVSVTYGTNSSISDGGSSLPWKAYLPVTSNVQFYNVSAQLQGSDGRVTCTAAVYVDGTEVTQTGTTSAHHNVASAKVCSNSTGGWRRC
jgi:hypothetical protein